MRRMSNISTSVISRIKNENDLFQKIGKTRITYFSHVFRKYWILSYLQQKVEFRRTVLLFTYFFVD